MIEGNSPLETSPHKFGSSVWHRKCWRLSDTLTLDTGIAGGCPGHNTQSLLGNMDPILGRSIDTPPLEIENQVKFPVES